MDLSVAPLADLAITFWLPGDLPASFGITGRYARQTNSISPPGDFSAEAVMPVGRLTDDWYFVNGIDVLASPDTGGIVALGDSLTDANISTHDAFCRWPDQLARRLVARGGRAMGVMNQGLGGNRILHDIRGDSGLRRFDRDVLAQPGVTHAIVMLGTNDLRNRWAKPEEEVTAEQMIAGLKQMALRAHARGIEDFRLHADAVRARDLPGGCRTPAREAVRQAVNAWIRAGGAFDAVVDFDKGDPEHPTSWTSSTWTPGVMRTCRKPSSSATIRASLPSSRTRSGDQSASGPGTRTLVRSCACTSGAQRETRGPNFNLQVRDAHALRPALGRACVTRARSWSSST